MERVGQRLPWECLVSEDGHGRVLLRSQPLPQGPRPLPARAPPLLPGRFPCFPDSVCVWLCVCGVCVCAVSGVCAGCVVGVNDVGAHTLHSIPYHVPPAGPFIRRHSQDSEESTPPASLRCLFSLPPHPRPPQPLAITDPSSISPKLPSADTGQRVTLGAGFTFAHFRGGPRTWLGVRTRAWLLPRLSGDCGVDGPWAARPFQMLAFRSSLSVTDW